MKHLYHKTCKRHPFFFILSSILKSRGVAAPAHFLPWNIFFRVIIQCGTVFFIWEDKLTFSPGDPALPSMKLVCWFGIWAPHFYTSAIIVQFGT